MMPILDSRRHGAYLQRRKFTCNCCKGYVEKWSSKFAIALLMTILLIIVLLIFEPFQSEINVLVLDVKNSPLCTVDKHFLSLALDSSLIATGFHGFNLTNAKIWKLLKPFEGGYLRVGGTMADRLIFEPTNRSPFKNPVYKYFDGEGCLFGEQFCISDVKPNFTMSGKEWIQLNHLAAKAGVTILFDLNALIRYGNGSWDSRNAESLIAFSDRHKFNISWELGNEPNSFEYVFNYEVNATQLANDFIKLKELLGKYNWYNNSFIVGPDITRPRNDKVTDYLREFLIHSDLVLDAITWHQYYFNGREAILHYFIDPIIFDELENEMILIKNAVVEARKRHLPIWLGETSSAYGGGAPTFSNKFIATFIWLDKLGLAARNGIEVVVRQSFFKGYYALIDEFYDPNPDWWLSVLYKKLVGNRVVKGFLVAPPEVRIYCHCSTENEYVDGPAITVFGMNMQNNKAVIRLQEAASGKLVQYDLKEFIIQTHVSILSKNLYLNDELLRLLDDELPVFSPVNRSTNILVLPPFSLGFWLIPSKDFFVCQ